MSYCVKCNTQLDNCALPNLKQREVVDKVKLLTIAAKRTVLQMLLVPSSKEKSL